MLPRGADLSQFVSKNRFCRLCGLTSTGVSFVFHSSATPSPKKAISRRAGCVMTLNIWSMLKSVILFRLFGSKFETIMGKTVNMLTFDFLILKLGLLGSSGPLNQVLMLNDAILTATRSNSFFRPRLVSIDS